MRKRPLDTVTGIDSAGENDAEQGSNRHGCEQRSRSGHMPGTPAHVAAQDLPIFKRCAKRSGMSPDSFVQALTQSSLRHLTLWTQADLEALLLASERHGLSPIGRELFLLRDGEDLDRPVLVVLGVDGWSRVINTHKKFAGVQFKESEELVDGVPAWIECTLHRWDRRVPTNVREYFIEVRGTTLAWLTHPRRMLRHKALVQCARIAFGLVGIYDHDEAQRVFEGKGPERQGKGSHPSLTRAKPNGRALGVGAVMAELEKRSG